MYMQEAPRTLEPIFSLSFIISIKGFAMKASDCFTFFFNFFIECISRKKNISHILMNIHQVQDLVLQVEVADCVPSSKDV